MNNRPKLIRQALVLIAAFCILVAAPVAAQTGDPSANPPDSMPNRGFFPGGTYSTNNIEAINVVAGDVNLAIPVAKLPPGRGGSTFGINLIYSSAIFDLQRAIVNNTLQLTYVPSSAGNWRYGFDYGIGWDTRPVVANGASSCTDQYYLYKAFIVMPDGSRRNLRLQGFQDNNGDSYYDISPFGDLPQCIPGGLPTPTFDSTTKLVYVTVDSSYIRVEVFPALKTWTIFLPNGTQVSGSSSSIASPVYAAPAGSAETITDRNGNSVFITQSCPVGGACTKTITDDVSSAFPNRSIVITYGLAPGGSADTVSWPGPQGTISATVDYTTVVLPNQQYSCSNNGQTCSFNNFAFQAVQSVVMPAAQTQGTPTSYAFDYNCPGCKSTWGELHTLTTPTGATVNYVYSRDNQISTVRPAGELRSLLRTKTVTYVPAATDPFTGLPGDISSTQQVTTYSITTSSDTTNTVVTAPDNSRTQYIAFGPSSKDKAGLIQSILYPDDSQVDYTWQQNTEFGSPASSGKTVPANPYIKFEIATLPDQQFATFAYTIDKNGNLLEEDEYNFTIASFSVPPRRKTTNAYWVATANAGIGNEPVTDDPNAYWNTSAPRYLRATQSRTITDCSSSFAASCSDGVIAAVTQYKYDDFSSSGNLTDVLQWDSTKGPYNAGDALSDANAIHTRATYVSHGNQQSVTDPNGNVSQTSYDSNDLYVTKVVVAQGLPEQRTASYSFDPGSGALLSWTDSDNSVTASYGYDRLGRQTRMEEVGPDVDRVSTTDYDDQKLTITSKQDKDSTNDLLIAATTFYDPLGRIRMITDPAGNISQKAYSQTTCDFCGVTYEATSNPFTLAAPNDSTAGWTLTSKYAYLPAQGEPTCSVGNQGQHNRTFIQNFGGSTPPSPFAGNSNRTGTVCTVHNGSTTALADATGHSHSYQIDALGRTFNVDGTVYSYDALDNLHTSGGRTFTYSSLSRLISSTSLEGGTTKYQYDNNGNLVGITSGLASSTASGGISICFGNWNTSSQSCDSSSAYDGLNRPRKKTYSDGTPQVTYQYDQDVKGTLSAVINANSTTTYAHDSLGRVKSSTQTTGSTSFPFSYKYSLADEITQITYPSGRTVQYALDNANRATKITNVATGAAYASINYTAIDVPSGVGLLNGVTEALSWNDRFQQTGMQATTSSNNLLSLGFSPCVDGSPSCSQNNSDILTQSISAPGLSVIQAFGYDGIDRITSANETGTTINWSQVYGNDPLGNHWVDPNANQGVPISSFTPGGPGQFDAQNHFINPALPPQGINYDPAGNQIVIGGYTRTYDAEGRLTSSTLNTTTNYVYDGLGQRVMKQTGSGSSAVTTTYIYDVDSNLAAQYDSSAAASPCGTNTCFISVDNLGSTRLLTDGTGNVARRYDFLPFGEEILAGIGGRTTDMGYQSAPDDFNPKFTGQFRDTESGLDFMNARYYSSAEGRFLSPDPDDAGADIDDPQSWNGYSYVTNNPLNSIDPSGLSTITFVNPPSGDASSLPWNWQITFTSDPFGGPWAFGPNPFLFYGAPNTAPPANPNSTPVMAVAVGHHLLSNWSKLAKGTEAYKYFSRLRTGPLADPKTNYFDSLHRLYNDAVDKLKDQFVKQVGKKSTSDLSREESKRLAQKIMNSKDPRIQNFLRRLGSRALGVLEGLIDGGTEFMLPITVGLELQMNIRKCGQPRCVSEMY